MPDSFFALAATAQCINAVSSRCRRPRTDPSITRSPASSTAPPITSGSILLLQFDFTVEAFLQCGLDRVALRRIHCAGAAQGYLEYVFGFALESIEQCVDLGQQTHALVLDEQAQERGERRIGRFSRRQQQADQVAIAQTRIADDRTHARVAQYLAENARLFDHMPAPCARWQLRTRRAHTDAPMSAVRSWELLQPTRGEVRGPRTGRRHTQRSEVCRCARPDLRRTRARECLDAMFKHLQSHNYISATS